MISTLNFSSFSTYILFFFSTNSLSICYSTPLTTFTPAFFIFFTTLITSLFLLLAFFIFSTISISSPPITTSCKLCNQQSLINTWFLLFFSIPTFQSGHLLSLSTFPIFVPNIYFKVKSNLDRYNAHWACLQFNFYTFMKYSKFLWSVQTSNLYFTPSSKFLQFSKPLITTNISLSWIS